MMRRLVVALSERGGGFNVGGIISRARQAPVLLSSSSTLSSFLSSCSPFSTSVVAEGEVTSATGGETTTTSKNKTSKSKSKRNPVLASVIRDGLISLNQTAVRISQSKHAQRPLFVDDETNNKKGWKRSSSPKLLAESHRILNVANTCLEEMAMMHNTTMCCPSISFMGETIIIVHVDVRPSLQVATIYWTLPLQILLNDNYTIEQKIELQDAFAQRQQQILSSGGGNSGRGSGTTTPALFTKLKNQVYSILARGTYPPKIRWEPATPEMMYSCIHEFNSN